LKISISKDSAVSIRDQLIEQLGLQIASGTLKPYEKLPSIRALAARLGVHYSTITAAYNHMAEVGLLEIRQGSGVRVAAGAARFEEDNGGATLSEMCEQFLAQAAERGYSRGDVLAVAETLKQRKPVKRLLCVDANLDFHKVLMAELAPHFVLPVQTITPKAFVENPQEQEESLIVASLYHLFAFQKQVRDLTRLVACNIEPGRSHIEAVEKLPQGSLVVLVSASPTLLHMASNLMAAIKGDEVGLRCLDPQEEQELKYLQKHADLFITDKISIEVVKASVGEKKVRMIELYSHATIARIQDRLAKWG
jgi:GntR family transcriptional regulator